jgi:hypothetical protein
VPSHAYWGLKANVMHDSARITRHCFSWCFDALMTKVRRIIDEWDSGVKWKISLSFKGIIDIARAADGAGNELRREMFQGPMHSGFSMDWGGMNETDGVVAREAGHVSGAGQRKAELTAACRSSASSTAMARSA